MLLFATADAVLTAVSFAVAYSARSGLPMRALVIEPSDRVLLLVASVVAVVAAGRWTGTYARIYSGNRSGVARGIVQQAGAASLAMMALLYLLNLDVPVSRLFLAFFFACLASLQLLQRIAAQGLRGRMRKALGVETSVVVIGDGERAVEMASELEQSERHGIRLLAIVGCGRGLKPEIRLRRTYRVRSLEDLPAMLNEEIIDEVLFAVASERLRDLEDVFVLCDEHGVKTRVAADFFPHVHSRVHFDRLGERPLLTFSTAPADELQLLLKRCLDAGVATASLLVLLLPMVVVAALVKLTSKGPVFFRQTRCGLNGRAFTCYKFRSMTEDAESRRHEVEHLNEKDGPAFKLRDDPRLTRVGGLLRRFSVDEWPQFWNVLRGDMSIVGPRPAVPSEVSQYQTWQRRRLRMRPGLTCLWAIRGRDGVDFDNWMQMDLEYIDNWSLLLDLRILVLTVPVVIRGRGAS